MQPIKINLSTKAGDNHKLIISILLIVLLVGSLGTGMGIAYGKARQELRYQEAINLNLKAKNTELKKLQEVMEKQQDTEKQWQSKTKNVEVLIAEATLLSRAFEQIEAAVTPDIQVIGVEIDKSKILVTGLFTEHTEIAKMLAALRATDTFSNVKLVSTQATPSSAKLAFKIETIWEAPER